LDAAPTTSREHWALRDVSFRIEPGETVGVLGRNGAGKSTLLRILAEVTPPSSGKAIVAGRVGSLLEVGAGFSAELTGRDNIWLVGAILGMTRREVARRFDDIVAFSGVGAFIDDPVKRYSSGMYLRLAFSVAAHVDADILLIDEALAVGDREFRERCLARLRELSADGRTVLFVSHDMASVARLCQRALVIDSGTLRFDGDCDAAIASYLGALDAGGMAFSAQPGTERASITEVTVSRPGHQNAPAAALQLDIELGLPPGWSRPLTVTVDLVGPDLWAITGSRWSIPQPEPTSSDKLVRASIEPPATRRRVRCCFPSLRLGPGAYRASVTLSDADGELAQVSRLGPIEVVDARNKDPMSWRYHDDAHWSLR
jgi:ABC-type polysaccharide/polyol phosphate transport system ATPase subunit